jgi:hypothetical protein
MYPSEEQEPEEDIHTSEKDFGRSPEEDMTIISESRSCTEAVKQRGVMKTCKSEIFIPARQLV